MTKYYGMVSLMDHHIGRILDKLEDEGLIDNTIIVFTSDHGDYMGNHGLWWKGLPAYDDALRIPFIVSYPECETKGKHTGIFWSWFNTSMLLGNIFLFFYLGDSEAITSKERHVIYLVLGTLCTLGMLAFLFLRAPPPGGVEEVSTPTHLYS